MLIFFSLNLHALHFHTLCSWVDPLAFAPLFTLCHGKKMKNKQEEDTETEIKRKERREGWREGGKEGWRWSAGHSITGWTSAQGAEGEPHFSATVYSLSVCSPSLSFTHTQNILKLTYKHYTKIINHRMTAFLKNAGKKQNKIWIYRRNLIVLFYILLSYVT